MNYRDYGQTRMCGLDWFELFQKHDILSEKFDMYLLTVSNLEKALKKLLVNH